MEKVNFLSFIVGKHGVEVDEEKIKAIRDWPTSKNTSEVRSFYGLASFYMKFIKDFSTTTTPLNDLVKKNVVFKWEEMQENALNELKKKLTVPTLIKLLKLSEIECDASSLAIGVVLMQDGKRFKVF